MKRSRHIRLVLTGAVAGATLAGCGPSDSSRRVSADRTYTNNQYTHGVGYYHAPYHRWFPFPYNHHVAGQGYYFGGGWSPTPDTPSTTASKPAADAARLAQAQQTTHRSSTTSRGGFGGSSRSGLS